ncbi:putative zinc-finger of transcription factor IIIC complex-domain-containing protein [Paraphysoderma sedebokerense]|nr:putative zinc-finger of transcription factor IIIC complex-domain-containing protein [Paraphysoderma sedebokerense]
MRILSYIYDSTKIALPDQLAKEAEIAFKQSGEILFYSYIEKVLSCLKNYLESHMRNEEGQFPLVFDDYSWTTLFHFTRAVTMFTTTASGITETSIGLLLQLYTLLLSNWQRIRNALSKITIDTLELWKNHIQSVLNGEIPDAEKLGVVGQENCPACSALVQFQSTEMAICMNGHMWDRCSITLNLIPTPFARGCRECTRKALNTSVLSSSLDFVKNQRVKEKRNVGRSNGHSNEEMSLVNVLLTSACWCVYCGNRFTWRGRAKAK